MNVSEILQMGWLGSLNGLILRSFALITLKLTINSYIYNSPKNSISRKKKSTQSLPPRLDTLTVPP